MSTAFLSRSRLNIFSSRWLEVEPDRYIVMGQCWPIDKYINVNVYVPTSEHFGEIIMLKKILKVFYNYQILSEVR